jgi:alkylhydroperoxidase family enzyme
MSVSSKGAQTQERLSPFHNLAASITGMKVLRHSNFCPDRFLAKVARTTAALTFPKRVLDSKGQISESDLDKVRSAGFSDGEIAEIIPHVALNVFTNYFNTATDVEIDFPKVSYSEVVISEKPRKGSPRTVRGLPQE